MKKLAALISIIFIFISALSAQSALVDKFLIISDGAGGTQTLNFGVDTAATDGIDLYLGEAPLPPLPPSGIFDVRFNLPGGTESSHKDFREGNIPFNGENIHEIQYQVGSGTTIQIDWDLPADSSIKGRLQDVVLGTIIDVPMIGSGSYTVANPGAFNKLKMTVIYSDAVPVELTSFTASIGKNNVMLNWVTATEINNRGFEIERASRQVGTTPIQGWERIGFVQGYGSTTTPKEYTFTDNKLNGGNKIQYRLKQLDYNGQYEYSNIVEVEIFLNKFSLYQNFPNPFNPSTKIQYAISKQQYTTLKVYNVLGNEIETLVNEVKPAGVYEVTLNADKLPSGVYFYKIQAGSFVEIKKMTLLR